MGRYSNGGWAPYVPVAERRRQAARKTKELSKRGHICQPIIIEGRTIGRSLWARAWCDNLEAYSDYDNRLPRGRTYVRNGSVVDLSIEQGKVSALVSGSEMYTVAVTVQALEPASWRAIVQECAGQIGSLVELLQGRLSHAVMAVVTRPGSGLFPTPQQIAFRCSCPDGASMCKHVAAVLYGVGARLDQQPELLFLLRHTDPQELIRQAGSVPMASAGLAQEQRLEGADLGSLFGIDLDDATTPGEAKPAEESPAPGSSQPPAQPLAPAAALAKPDTRRPGRQTAATPAAKKTPAQAGPRTAKKTLSPTATAARQAGQRVTARELTARGLPHYMLQNWLSSGVLLHTSVRGEYQTTAQTEERIVRYLGRPQGSNGKA